MNRFFRRVIITILAFGAEMGLILMLRFGSPMFKILIVASMVAVVWAYLNYLKTDRKKRKVKSKEKEDET